MRIFEWQWRKSKGEIIRDFCKASVDIEATRRRIEGSCANHCENRHPRISRGGRGGGGRRDDAKNVLGESLGACSVNPMTGFLRNRCCDTGPEDIDSHTVCAVMTESFLRFSKSRGNDLSTPRPEFGFAGLKPGDRWCLCVPRWQEALEAGHAPRVALRA